MMLTFEDIRKTYSERSHSLPYWQWLEANYVALANSYEQVVTERDRLSNWVLRQLLQAQISEALAAELLGIGIVEVRDRMIKRYGEHWRDATGDNDKLRALLLAAGDLDNLVDYLDGCGFEFASDGQVIEKQS